MALSRAIVDPESYLELPTDIVVESLDSRFRDDPEESTQTEYSIRLSREHYNVSAFKIADFALGYPDPRLTFDASRRRFRFSHPIHLLNDTDLEVTPYGASAVHVRLSRTVVPSVSASYTSGNTVDLTFASDTEALTVVHTVSAWPVAPLIVITEYHQRPLEVTAVAHTAPSSVVTLTLSTGSGLSTTTFDGGCAVLFPRLTAKELTEALQSRVSALVPSGSFRVAYDDSLDQVAVFGPVKTSDYTKTTVNAAGEALALLGAGSSASTFAIPRAEFRRYVPVAGRTAFLTDGRYDTHSSADFLQALELACSPLHVSPTASVVPQVAGVSGTGAAFAISCLRGNPTPAQLAQYLTDQLASYYVEVTYVASTGLFTFTEEYGRPFSLDFATTDARRLAGRMLGFVETPRPTGASAYSSSTGSSTGASAASSSGISGRSLRDGAQPRIPIYWTAHPVQKKLVTSLAPSPSGYDRLFVEVGAVSGNIATCVAYTDGTYATLAHHGLITGDLVYVVDDAGNPLPTVVNAISSDGTEFDIMVATGTSTMSTTLPGGLSSGQTTCRYGSRAVTQVHTVNPTVVADIRSSGIIHSDKLGATPSWTSDDPLLVSPTFVSTVYGSLRHVLGLPKLATAVPFVTGTVNVDPYDYVLLELVEPAMVDRKHTHLGPDGTVRTIMAKIILSKGYARISNDYNAIVTTGVIGKVTHLKFRFLNPDLTPVQWNGHDHSLQILVHKRSDDPNAIPSSRDEDD